MLLKEFSPTEKSSTSWGQDKEWKLFLKIFTHSTKRRQEVPSSLKFSNSSPSSSSTCLHEDWQPGSGTYYPWKHRLLTTQLTVGSVKLVQTKLYLKKEPRPQPPNAKIPPGRTALHSAMPRTGCLSIPLCQDNLLFPSEVWCRDTASNASAHSHYF